MTSPQQTHTPPRLAFVPVPFREGSHFGNGSFSCRIGGLMKNKSRSRHEAPEFPRTSPVSPQDTAAEPQGPGSTSSAVTPRSGPARGRGAAEPRAPTQPRRAPRVTSLTAPKWHQEPKTELFCPLRLGIEVAKADTAQGGAGQTDGVPHGRKGGAVSFRSGLHGPGSRSPSQEQTGARTHPSCAASEGPRALPAGDRQSGSRARRHVTHTRVRSREAHGESDLGTDVPHQGA